MLMLFLLIDMIATNQIFAVVPQSVLLKNGGVLHDFK